MASEMVERVAQALIGVPGVALNSSVEDMLPVARAAIEAMREPTSDMLTAAEPTTWDIPLANGTFYKTPGLGSGPAHSWRKMIDAALA